MVNVYYKRVIFWEVGEVGFVFIVFGYVVVGGDEGCVLVFGFLSVLVFSGMSVDGGGWVVVFDGCGGVFYVVYFRGIKYGVFYGDYCGDRR